jgi:hypothetical protein
MGLCVGVALGDVEVHALVLDAVEFAVDGAVCVGEELLFLPSVSHMLRCSRTFLIWITRDPLSPISKLTITTTITKYLHNTQEQLKNQQRRYLNR